jgi:DNA-directed RNA polymerase specialized sigma24 family protein
MFEIVMRRHNQRLYRVARAILHNDGEAEDVMQNASFARANIWVNLPGGQNFPPG